MKQDSKKIPIIVLGADTNGLGALRSLGDFQSTYIADTDSHKPGFCSKFGKKIVFTSLDNIVVSKMSLIENLYNLRDRFQKNPFLIPTHEDTVHCLTDNYDRIRNDFVLQYPPKVLMKKLLHKADFKTLAIENDFLVPRTLSVGSFEDMEGIYSLNLPLILKPVWKSADYNQFFQKAYILQSYEEVQRLYTQIHFSMPEVVIQEWIDGKDDQIYFCLQYISRDQGLISSFVGQKLNQYPPQTGGTASCISRPDYHDKLTELTFDFFKKVGGVGFCNMEYKLNEADGKFYMIEPTVGRTDYQHEVSTLNGINVLKAAYLYESCGDLLSQNYTAIRTAWVDQEANEKAVLITKNDLMEALSGPIKIRYCLFRINDPWPWINSIFKRIQQKICKLWRGKNEFLSAT